MSVTLNEGSLNADTIHLTEHVVDRYMERRGWTGDKREAARLKIRELLHRVSHRHPPITCRPGYSPARFFVAGGFVWVVTADYSAVITFWKAKR